MTVEQTVKEGGPTLETPVHDVTQNETETRDRGPDCGCFVNYL